MAYLPELNFDTKDQKLPDLSFDELPISVKENPGSHPTFGAPEFNTGMFAPATALVKGGLQGVNDLAGTIDALRMKAPGQEPLGNTVENPLVKNIPNAQPGTLAGMFQDIGKGAVENAPALAMTPVIGMPGAFAAQTGVEDIAKGKGLSETAGDAAKSALLAKAFTLAGGVGSKFIPSSKAVGTALGSGVASAVGSHGDPASIVQGTAMGALFPQDPIKASDFNPIKGILPEKPIDQQIYDAANKGIQQGIRPSVAGKQTLAKSERFDQGAVDAVKDIVANKDSLQINDDNGNPMNNPLKGGIKGFAQAIQQRMDSLVKNWQDLASQAGDNGAKINSKPYLDKLNSMLDEQGVDESGKTILGKKGQIFQTEHPADYSKVKAIRDGLQLRGDLTPADALDKIQEWNADLKPGYNSGFKYGNARAQNVVKGLVENLRGDLDKSITDSTGSEFQPLRTLWSSYKSLTKDVMNRARVAVRANPQSIWSFLDAVGNAELLHGAMSANLPLMIKGVAMKGGKMFIQHANDPDTIVNNMFSKVDSLMQKLPPTNGDAQIKPEVIQPGQPGFQYNPFQSIADQAKALPVPETTYGDNFTMKPSDKEIPKEVKDQAKEMNNNMFFKSATGQDMPIASDFNPIKNAAKKLAVAGMVGTAAAMGAGNSEAKQAPVNDKQMAVINQVATKYKLSPNQTKLLVAIRKAENGGAGKEFGVLTPEAMRFKSSPDKSFKTQAEWAAGSIKRHYNSAQDLEKFSRRWAPIGVSNDPRNLNANWLKNVRKFMQEA